MSLDSENMDRIFIAPLIPDANIFNENFITKERERDFKSRFYQRWMISTEAHKQVSMRTFCAQCCVKPVQQIWPFIFKVRLAVTVVIRKVNFLKGQLH